MSARRLPKLLRAPLAGLVSLVDRKIACAVLYTVAVALFLIQSLRVSRWTLWSSCLPGDALLFSRCQQVWKAYLIGFS